MRRSNEHGMAMLELIVVLSILALLSSFLLPKFQISDERRQLRHEATLLIAELRASQEARKIDNKLRPSLRFTKAYGNTAEVCLSLHSYCIKQNRVVLREHVLPAGMHLESNVWREGYAQHSIGFQNAGDMRPQTILLCGEQFELQIIIDKAGRVRLEEMRYLS